MKNKLSIAIPTYNRSEILKINLLLIIDELIEYNISVYISDDSTNRKTEVIYNELKEKHKNIFYFKNNTRLGHDNNCIKTILLPSETYVWYIGDSMIIKKGAIKKIIEIISIKEYDFISINALERINLNIEEKEYTNGLEILEDLGWHLTMTGTTIYNKNKLININNLDLKKCENFPQTAIIFEQFAIKKSSLYWINENLISGNNNKKSYWHQKVFEVFLVDFKNLIIKLPDYYPINSKNKTIRKHSKLSGIFNYHNFIKYRISKIYNLNEFKKYKIYFKKYLDLNILLLFIISVFPLSVLKITYMSIMFIFKKLKL
jgi:hypothetical protein